MSRSSKWLLILFLALMLYVAFTIVVGVSEGRTIFPFHPITGSIWAGYARDELQLAVLVLVAFAGSLFVGRRSGGDD